jgi:hypothetical protein
MNWTVLHFGKHKGKTLPLVLFRDPDWFFWACEQKIFRAALKEEADVLQRRACRIRVPATPGRPVEVEYFFDRRGVFSRLQVVPSGQEVHPGTVRTSVLDFSVPRSRKGYDKGGYVLFLRGARRLLFGSSRSPATKERAEAFFSDAENFDSPA